MWMLIHGTMLRWQMLAAATAIVVVVVGFAVGGRGPASSVAPRPDETRVDGTIEVSPPRPMPALSFVDGDGRPMTLGDFRGRAVLLNLWATWCVPCRKEMPSLDRLQAKLGGPTFLVLPLSIDRKGASVIASFYRELGLISLGIYAEQSGKATAALAVAGIPTTLLIDRDGREVGRALGPVEWDSPDIIDTIRRLLNLPDATQKSSGDRPRDK